MDSSGSVLQTLVNRVRLYADAPESDRYTDNEVLEEYVLSEWVNFWTDINMGNEDPVLMMYTLSLVAATNRYLLPPCVGEVWGLFQNHATDNLRQYEFRRRGDWHSAGPGWRVEGNEIYFEPTPSEASTWSMLYRPSGDMLPHVGSGTVVSSTVITLASSPTLGRLDRRTHAYVGMYLRTLDSGKVSQERIISAYDAATRRATVRIAFTQDSNHLGATDAAVAYEVAPSLYQPMISAVAAGAAMTMGPSAQFSGRKMQQLEYIKDRGVKAMRDHFENKLIRESKRIDRLTYSNPYLDGYDGPVIVGTR